MTDKAPDQESDASELLPWEWGRWQGNIARLRKELGRVELPHPRDRQEKPPRIDLQVEAEIRARMLATPYLAEDLIELRTRFRAEARHITRHNGAPFTSAFSIHEDTLERYSAALTGTVFDTTSLSERYPHDTPRQRRHIPTREITAERARDVYQVLDYFFGNDDPTDHDQLPRTPISGLTPITVVNNIVRTWSDQIATPNRPIHPDEKARLEAVVNLLLHEAHPDRQELLVPRRRESDTPISIPLLINTVERMKDGEEQKEFSDFLGNTSHDYFVTKAAVGAYTTLVKQHGLTPDVAGFAEMFRRGLLPLALLTQNDAVVGRISALIGREKDEIYHCVAKVEQLHNAFRRANIMKLADDYDAHLKRVMEARTDSSTVGARKKRPASATHDSEVSEQPDPQNQRPLPNRNLVALIEKAETYLEGAALPSTELIIHLSSFAQKMVKAKKNRIGQNVDPYLPVIDTKQLSEDMDPDNPAPLQLRLSASNLWFEAIMEQKNPTVRQQLRDPLGFSLLTPPPDESSSFQIEGFCGFIDARTADIFTDAVMSRVLTTLALQSETRDRHFVEFAYAIEEIFNRNDAGFFNILVSIREPEQFKQHIADTSSLWRKIANMKFLQQEPIDHPSNFDMSDEQATTAAMAVHMDKRMAQVIFAGRVIGLSWRLPQQDLDSIERRIKRRDPTGRNFAMACRMRAAYGTGGRAFTTDRVPLALKQTKNDDIVDALRPVAQHYDPIFVGRSGTMRSDLPDHTADIPTMPQR